MNDEGMKQIAPGVHVPARTRRVLKAGDPKGDDYRDAMLWIADIRSRLAHIRGELGDAGKLEAISERDRIATNAQGGLTLVIRALHDTQQKLKDSATRVDELWADVEANPDAYVIEDGVTLAKRGQKAEQEWDWKPSGIFKRGDT